MHLRWSPLCEATYLYQYSSWVVSGGKPNYRRGIEAGTEACPDRTRLFYGRRRGGGGVERDTGALRYVLSEWRPNGERERPRGCSPTLGFEMVRVGTKVGSRACKGELHESRSEVSEQEPRTTRQSGVVDW